MSTVVLDSDVYKCLFFRDCRRASSVAPIVGSAPISPSCRRKEPTPGPELQSWSAGMAFADVH
jgi:hypothetical protein